MSHTKIVALVWAPHEGRTASFATWLNAKLFNVHYLKHRQPIYAPFKYPLQWIKTWQLLFQNRPDYIYVTNSPPVAGLCVYVYCLFTSSKFILDTHTPNLFTSKWAWTRPLQRFTSRRAIMNVVDQQQVAELFESWKSKVLVLPNPPKDIPIEWLQEPDETEISITYVGTLVDDEPVDIVINAARMHPQVKFYILGDKALANPKWLQDVPENVIFTGYLLKDEYWKCLSRSRAIISLSTLNYSLLGGAQDGLHINKPLIVSDTATLRLYFTKGTIFVDNTNEGMIRGIEDLLNNEERLKREIRELQDETSARWQESFQALKAIVNV